MVQMTLSVGASLVIGLRFTRCLSVRITLSSHLPFTIVVTRSSTEVPLYRRLVSELPVCRKITPSSPPRIRPPYRIRFRTSTLSASSYQELEPYTFGGLLESVRLRVRGSWSLRLR